MNRTKYFLPAALLALTGCDTVSWLQPLDTGESTVREPAFEGQWRDGNKAAFTVKATEDGYRLSDKDSAFQATLVRLSGELYLDLVEQGNTGIPEHMFLRVEIGGARMRWFGMKSDLVDEALKLNLLDHVRYRDGKDTRRVITASSWDTQNFLLRHRSTLWEPLTEFQRFE